MFFGKGDEQLALDADSVVCRKEEGAAPPSPLFGTLLCRRARVQQEKRKKTHKQNGGRESARHPGRSTFYAVLPVGGVRGQPTGLTAPPSSFQPPRSPPPPDRPSFTSLLPSVLPSVPSSVFGPVMSLLPPCCGVTGRQRLLLAASPVDTVVMSLPPGSTIGQIPALPNGQRHWFTALGSGGLSHGGTVRRCDAEPPRSAPLHAPAEVND